MSKVKEIKFNESTRSFAGIRELHQKVFDFGWSGGSGYEEFLKNPNRERLEY